MELLNEEPLLLQIYDMITDSWINELKKTAMPSLKRPPPVGKIKIKNLSQQFDQFYLHILLIYE